MTPNKTQQASASTDAVDPKQTHLIAEFQYEVALTTLRVDPAERFVAAGAEDRDVQLWNLKTGDRQTLTGHKSWVRSIDFTSDGSRMLTACWGGEVRIWDTSAAVPKLLHAVKAHQGAARFVRISPDDRTFATCGNDLKVRVFNIGDGQLTREFAGHDRHVYGVDFHPDGTHLVSQDLMGRINIWDIEDDKPQRTIDAKVMTGYDNKFAADMGGARDMMFNADGSQWASAGITNVVNSFAGTQDPIIVVFDWESGKELQQIKSPDDNVKGIAWGVNYHPDGFLIGAVADRTGKGELWFHKVGEEKPLHTMKLPSGARGLDLLSDNRRIVTAHVDGRVRLHGLFAKPPEKK